MSTSHVVVIDTSFRRHNIKVTPGKYMTDILEEACKKFGIKSSNYGLKHANKPVDLSRTFRQTGLTTGAKLELVVASRTPSAVSVALQIPEAMAGGVTGSRLTDKVPSDTTLWRILRKFESTEGTNLNFTGRGVTNLENGATGAGTIVYEMPVLNIMGRELGSFGDLQKTLAQLGVNSGSCLIRLNFKKTPQPLQEAMTEIQQYFREEETPADSEMKGVEVSPLQEVDSITEGISRISSQETTPSRDVEMAADEQPDLLQNTPLTPSKRPAPDATPEPKQEEEILGPNQRPISIFSPPSSDTPKAALLPHNEDDFEATIRHAKAHQQNLLNRSRNQKLLSDAETEQAEQEKAAKLAKMKEVKIKVRFPDQSSVVSKFTATDTGDDLYNSVTGVIVAEDQPFKLVYNDKGVQTVPRSPKKLIKDLGFEGSVLVNFVWEDSASDDSRKGSTLKPQYAQKAQALPIPVVASVVQEEAGPSASEKGKEKENSGGGAGPKLKGAMPKWLAKGLQKK
ncbi:Tether containing UBX domain for GLUT4 [Lachnellula occidentalis]|uniref:Tether containing UBX domain for GLUT4 n=1 Tax=Lachnellula occidentalis TaxID=215460 RepID=A0A8H8S526_9HELO|nr:Tether containing UBX domain for GLUT4 [Lachnellula occidentalis]